MSVLSIVEVAGPLPDVVAALQRFRGPATRRTRADWAGDLALLYLGSATGTALWVEEDRLTVVNIHDRDDTGIAESVMTHLDASLPYQVCSSLRFVA